MSALIFILALAFTTYVVYKIMNNAYSIDSMEPEVKTQTARIDKLYIRLFETDRKLDGFMEEVSGQIEALQDYNAETEEKEKKAREAFNMLLGCADGIVMVRERTTKQPAKEVTRASSSPEADLQEPCNVKQKAAANRERFAGLRKKGNSVREAAKELGVSLTTAKSYEKWRKAQEQ